MTEEEKITRILFVDDDRTILDSIERMFFDMDEWEMDFVDSGKEALELIEEEFYDVIVSDMRMPEMNGAELLDRVQNISPSTIRFILSGYSDQEMILKTVGSADQFLSKPCDSELLKIAIKNAQNSLRMIGREELQRIGKNIDTLPTIPKLYQEISKIIEDDKSSINDVASVIEKDIGVTAKIIQLVNSSFFGHPNHIENLTYAISYIGLETLKSIILCSSMFESFSKNDIHDFDIEGIYQHSTFVSTLARAMMKQISSDTKKHDIASMAGMLHDLGKLILIQNRPDEYRLILKRYEEENVSIATIEKEILGTTHSKVGFYLVNKWGLSEEISFAILYHHKPKSEISENAIFSAVVHVADYLSYRGTDNSEYLNGLNEEILEKLDLLKYLPQWESIADKMLESEEK